MLKVVKPFNHPLLANTYVIGNEGEACIVVDPGNNLSHCLDRYIDKHHNGVVLGYLLTHGHFDHIYGLKEASHIAPLYMHEGDVPYLTDPSLNLFKHLVIDNFPIVQVADGEEIHLGNFSFKIIHTPFHTPGSVCFLFKEDKILFSGDSLFHLSIGRTDLPGSEPRKITSSLAKIKSLDPLIKIYPGHEKETDLASELRLNPFLAG